MERERPPYLPEVKTPRWSFPWLLIIGICVLALAMFGVKQHLATQAAWNQRFNQPRPEQQSVSTELEIRESEAERQAKIAEIRLIRASLERKRAEERKAWRCINHIPFRQIPGGWENVPGESC